MSTWMGKMWCEVSENRAPALLMKTMATMTRTYRPPGIGPVGRPPRGAEASDHDTLGRLNGGVLRPNLVPHAPSGPLAVGFNPVVRRR